MAEDSGAAVYASAYNQVSDRRSKNFIEEIGSEYGLSYINSLLPVSYLMKDSDKRELGFIAQDIEETNKSNNLENDIVSVPENPDDSYYVSYSKMVVPLVKAVQELSSEIEKLKKEIKILKEKK